MRAIQKTSRILLPVAFSVAGMLGVAVEANAEPVSVVQTVAVPSNYYSLTPNPTSANTLRTTSDIQKTDGNSRQKMSKTQNQDDSKNSLSKLIVAGIISFIVFIIAVFFAVRTPKDNKTDEGISFLDDPNHK